MATTRRTLVAVAVLVAALTGACGDDDGASVREEGPGAGSGSGASGSASGASGPGSASAPASGSASAPASGSASDAATDCKVVGGTEAAPTTEVEVRLDDWRITLSKTGVKQGVVELVAVNRGHHPHEVVVIRGVAPADLPRDERGAVVEERLPAGALVGEIEAFPPGGECEGTFALHPGMYTLVCNVVDGEEVHAQLGMVTTLTVS